MRQLTYEEQQRVSADDPIGTLEEQGLSPESNGSGFTLGNLIPYITKGSIPDWRSAVAIGCVRRSRYGTWEPFRTKTGGERSISCNEGVAHASDGVHILILGFDGRWFSRSSQVVEFHLDAAWQPGYDSTNPKHASDQPRRRVNAAKFLKDGQTIKPTKSLADEYMNL